MKRLAAIAVAVACLAEPAQAQTSRLQAAMAAGVRACQEWVLEPQTWANDPAQFSARVNLAEELVAIAGLPRGVLPDEFVASATNYWRIDGGDGNGVFIAASVNVPICNAAGGGPSDFQPGADTVVIEAGKSGDWAVVDNNVAPEMVSTVFESTADPKAELLISRAPTKGGRTDRVQFLATVSYKIGN